MKPQEMEKLANESHVYKNLNTNDRISFLLGLMWLNAYTEAYALDRNEWISVEERLPDQCDEECICTDGKEVTCLIFKTDGFYSLVFEGIVVGITHWQPLPKPPIK